MNNPIRLPLLFLLSVILAAVEPAAKPNPVVEKAMSAALADAEKGYDAYKAILAKATDKAVKDMEKAKLEVMKKGDLASANELDARIKELKEGGLEKLVMERKNAGGDLLGGNTIGKAGMAKYIGTWLHSGSFIYNLSSDGTFTSHGNNNGTWNIDKDGGIVLNFTSGSKSPSTAVCPRVSEGVHWHETAGRSFVKQEKK